MDRVIPHHPCCRLGYGLDVTKRRWECGRQLVAKDVEPVSAEPNFTTAQFSFVESMKDVCDILGIPPEYALKVKANIVSNPVVKECLRYVNSTKVTTVVFRVTFLQRKIYLPYDVKLISESTEMEVGMKPAMGVEKTEDENFSMISDTGLKETECADPEKVAISLLSDISLKADEEIEEGYDSGTSPYGSMNAGIDKTAASTGGSVSAGIDKTAASTGGSMNAGIDRTTPSTSGSKSAGHGAHCVSAIEVGNEMVVILRIASSDIENFFKFSTSLKEALKQFRGILDAKVFKELQTFASKTETKLKKKHYHDVVCKVHYGCFSEQESYPSNLTGMVRILQEFLGKSEGWKEVSRASRSAQSALMILKEGISEEKKGILSRLKSKNTVQNAESSYTGVKTPVGAYHAGSDVDGDHESFVVLASETDQMFNMRVTLQADQPEDSEIERFTSFALSQYPETSRGRFEKLFGILNNVEKAVTIIQQFFRSGRFMCDDRVREGNQLLQCVQNVQLEVHEAILNLDMITMPSEEFVESLCSVNALQIVTDYIENVMSKLPPGCDLDLLIIGKTGHGKSSTGNAILGQEKFVASASAQSVTKRSSVAWGNVDGRIIKAVDTPGVCDTAEDKDSIEQAIHAISEAITHCPGGFHALLLVIRFGQRMTMEERKAIGMLKCILGETVIESHCICVITHGDNFETEMKGQMSFKEWCRQEASGFLKDIFEECEYRCVLFNNKSEDPKVTKGQLIELVNMVDSLKSRGTRYTNSLFEYAQHQREKIITEECIPQVSTEMMRDIELVLDHLKRVSDNTEKKEKYASELENLKGMVENLSNRVTEVEGDQVKLLVETVFSLAEVIHGEIDKIADRANPDPPDNTNTETECSDNAQVTEIDTAPMSLDLQTQTQNLQNFRDTQITNQANEVDNKVAEQVAEKIEAEKNCFPAGSKVVLKNGIKMRLEDLKVGEEVLVRNEKGECCFDTVYMFGHRDCDTVAEFIILHVQDESVSVSEDHLVFCVRDGLEISLPARDIRVSDEIIMSSSDFTALNAKPVVKITRERKRGLFAPFTKSGTIVVDGAVMSCYVDVSSHASCHALLSPIRLLYRFSPATLAFVNGGVHNKQAPLWAKVALKWL